MKERLPNSIARELARGQAGSPTNSGSLGCQAGSPTNSGSLGCQAGSATNSGSLGCSPHPDADLLTAFAENALTAREREGVLGHLAVCAYCREIVGTSVAAAPEASPASAMPLPERRPTAWFRAWMPWVATAAAVAVVSSAVLLQQGGKRPPAETPAIVAKTESAPPPEPQTPPEIRQQAQPTKPAPPKAERPRSPAPPPETAARIRAEQENAVADSTSRAKVADRSEAAAAQVQADTQHAVPAPLAPMPPSPGNAPASAGGTKSVAPMAKRAAPALVPEMHRSMTSGAAKSRGEMAAEGAREGVAETAVRPRWRIDEAGRLQRAFGQGEWQTVLTNDAARFRVVAVVGSDVWVGGESLRLYHSSDSGNTWTPVALPAVDNAGSSIIRLRFDSATAGRVESDTGTVWTTTDAGRTWK